MKTTLARVWSPILLIVALAYSPPLEAQVPELSYTVVKSWSTLYDTTIANPAYGSVNSPDGIAWDGSGLWITDCGGADFAKFDTDGNLVESFALPGGDIADHLAWDGTYLWANVHSHPDDPGASDPTASPDGRIIQIDTTSHEIIKTIEIPWADWGMSPMGLGWDGHYLWTNGHMAKQIYRIDPDTLEGLETPAFPNPPNPFNPAGQINSCGNASDGQSCLWVSDLNAGVYFQVDTATGDIVSYLRPPENPDPTKYGSFRPAEVRKLFTGMTTDGTNRVWIMDEVEGNPLVYEILVDFPTTGACAHPVDLGESCVPGGQPFCNDGAVCTGDAGAETCQVGVADAGLPDAGSSPEDAGAAPDAGTGSTPGSSGGCAISARRSSSSGIALILPGLLFLLLRRRVA